MFASPGCQPLAHATSWEALRDAARRAGLDLDGEGRLSPHSLRHTDASMLIATGLNVVYISQQLGHTNPTITLSTYAHLFRQADHAATARATLEASYADICETGP